MRNSHVSAEQYVTKVKRLPPTCCLKCLWPIEQPCILVPWDLDENLFLKSGG